MLPFSILKVGFNPKFNDLAVNKLNSLTTEIGPFPYSKERRFK